MDNDNYLHRYINAEWIDILFTNDYTPFKLHPYFCFTKLPITPFIHFHFNKYFWILIIINCVLTWSIKCTCDPYQILMSQPWIGSYLAVLLYISSTSIKKKRKRKLFPMHFQHHLLSVTMPLYRHCMRILDSILMNNWYLWHQNVLMKKHEWVNFRKDQRIGRWLHNRELR